MSSSLTQVKTVQACFICVSKWRMTPWHNLECLSKSAALTLIHSNSKQPRSPAVTLEVPALPWPPDWWTPPRPPRRRWGWRCCSPRFWRACWAHSALRDVRPLTESVCGACLSAHEPLCLDVLVFWSGELAVFLSVCVREQEPPPAPSLSVMTSLPLLWMLACTCTRQSCVYLFIHYPVPHLLVFPLVILKQKWFNVTDWCIIDKHLQYIQYVLSGNWPRDLGISSTVVKRFNCWKHKQ